MMKVLKNAFFLVAMFLSTTGWGGQNAGMVTQLEGMVSVIDGNGVTHTVQMGESVYEGDVLVTSTNGQVHLRMSDEAYLALRPNTRLRIDSYQTTNKTDGRSMLSLLTGSLQAVTGWIGKTNHARYTVRTPTATLGVRGTDYELVFVPEGESMPDKPAGVYDRVYEGKTFLDADSHYLEVGSGLVAFAPLHQLPRLLEKPPSFLDVLPALDKKLEAIKPELQEKVQQQIELIKQLREQLIEHAQRQVENRSPPEFLPWAGSGRPFDRMAPLPRP